MSKFERLRELKPCDIEYFDLTGKKFIGKVCEVFSGSLCDIIILLGNIVLKFKCQLKDVNFDEDDGKTLLIKRTMDVNLLGVEAADEIKEIEQGNNKLVYVECVKFNSSNLLEVILYNIGDDINSINSDINLST